MKRKHLVVLVAAVLGLALLVPEVAEAQGYGYRPQRKPQFGYRHRMHGYVGGQLMGMAMLAQGVESADRGYIGSGGGFGLFGGVRLNPFVALELNWTYTAHDEEWECDGGAYCSGIDLLQIQTVTADFKLHIPTRGRIEPFVQAGGGFAFIGVSGDYAEDGYIFNSGPTFSLGGGADFWLSPFFTIGGRLLYRGTYFGTEDEYAGIARNSNYVSGISVDFNVQIHF
jgi:hypothetical protein